MDLLTDTELELHFHAPVILDSLVEIAKKLSSLSGIASALHNGVSYDSGGK